MHGENRNTYKVLSEKLEKKRKLERPRPRCEDNIDTDREEIGREGVEFLVQDRDMSLAVRTRY